MNTLTSLFPGFQSLSRDPQWPNPLEARVKKASGYSQLNQPPAESGFRGKNERSLGMMGKGHDFSSKQMGWWHLSRDVKQVIEKLWRLEKSLGCCTDFSGHRTEVMKVGERL